MNSAETTEPARSLGSLLSIRPLKKLVMSELDEHDPLRDVILAEKDDLTPAEFISKLEVWIVLLNRRA